MSLDATTNPIYSPDYRVQGTCHLHGDVDCGKINKTGTDGKVYPGRVQCTKCGQIFCRNGLWKKFGELVQGKDCAQWVCRLCLGTCCCRYPTTCRVEVPDHVEHSHCHNYRSAYGQREKRKRKRLLVRGEARKTSVLTTMQASGQLLNPQERKAVQPRSMQAPRPIEGHGNTGTDSLPDALRALCRLYATTYTTEKSLAQILAEARYSHGQKWNTISAEAIADTNQVFSDYRLLNLLQDLLTYKSSTIAQQHPQRTGINSPRGFYPTSYGSSSSAGHTFYSTYSNVATTAPSPTVQPHHLFEPPSNGESYQSSIGQPHSYSDVVRNTNNRAPPPPALFPKIVQAKSPREERSASADPQKSKIGIKDILSAGA